MSPGSFIDRVKSSQKKTRFSEKSTFRRFQDESNTCVSVYTHKGIKNIKMMQKTPIESFKNDISKNNIDITS
jgi:hypothetical protein